VLHYQEGMMVLLKDGSELDGDESPPYYDLDRAAVQPTEDAGADAGDKEDPELLQVGVAIQDPGQHLLEGDKARSASRGAGRRRAGVRFP
jgi:hypothetical protein